MANHEKVNTNQAAAECANSIIALEFGVKIETDLCQQATRSIPLFFLPSFKYFHTFKALS